MLVNLCDYKQSVTLIANSGVQFLDFGLTPQDTASHGRFVRKTANGPLLRLDLWGGDCFCMRERSLINRRKPWIARDARREGYSARLDEK